MGAGQKLTYIKIPRAARADVKDRISKSCGSQHGSTAEYCKGGVWEPGYRALLAYSAGWTRMDPAALHVLCMDVPYRAGQFWRRLTAARKCGCSALQVEGDVHVGSVSAYIVTGVAAAAAATCIISFPLHPVCVCLYIPYLSRYRPTASPVKEY